MRAVLCSIALVSLGACAAPYASQEVSPALIAALNSQPDGYEGVIPATGQSFEIVSTAASSDRLCRVVSMERPDDFVVDSYCKSRGGEWR